MAGSKEDDDFSMLSDAERAAIVGDAADEQAALNAVIEEGKKAVKESTDDDTDAAEEAEAARVAAEAAAAAEKAGDKTDPAATEKTDPAGEPERTEQFNPVFTAPAVENFAEKMAALDAEKAAALKKMLDGEMEPDDYAKAEQKYLNDRDELRSANDRAGLAVVMAEQNSQQRWMWEVDQFKATVRKTDGVDYNKDPKALNVFDHWVKALANDPDNGDKAGDWFLTEAHKNTKLQLGIGKPTGADNKNDKREPDLTKIPVTLGKVPAAADGDTGNNEFAHLDQLDGLALEKALAAMPQDKQDRYLAAQ